jgi:hypothetical protein
MSEQTQNVNEEQKAPTKDQVMEFLKEQIDVKKLQLELQQLNTGLATNRAEELKALSFIAQLTNPRQEGNPYQGAPDGTPHKITQEDLDNNPELVEAGVEVGDDVIIPNQEPAEEEAPSKKLKKN